MTRIIAGSARGRVLQVPPTGTRPTSDRVREAMFSRLEHLDAIRDARVLDLYAGSGALGIEALSRGAQRAVFIERHPPAARVCQRNLAATGFADRGEVRALSVKKFLAAGPPGEPFHTVLADPPYDLAEAQEVIDALRPHLAPEAVLMWEQPVSAPELRWPEWLADLGSKVYGQTRVSYAELPPSEPAARP